MLTEEKYFFIVQKNLYGKYLVILEDDLNDLVVLSMCNRHN